MTPASATTLRSPHHFPVRPSAPGVAPAPVVRPAPLGTWRYQARPRRRWTYGAGLLLSVGLHTAIFFGFNDEVAPAATAVARPVETVLQMEMPPLPPEEPEQSLQELTETAPAATVAVPQLMEVPSAVALTDFTQQVDLRPRTDLDLAALKQMAIPTNHGRGGSVAAAIGNVFNLSDLDRIPEAISQVAPRAPSEAHYGSNPERVTIGFIVDAEGRVRAVRAVSSTNRDFEAAAIRGVERWKFRPGVKAGRKVATQMEVTLNFVLEDRAF